MFKIKDGYKLELKTPETMKLLGSTKKLIVKTKNGENILVLKVAEVVLGQCDLVDNQYQQKSEVLYSFTPNKSYAYLLNVEPSNLVFLKTYNTEFDEIIRTFTDQNGRSLDQPVKYKQEAYEKLIEMSRNNDYTTENLLDYLYHEKYYKLIGINLLRQTNMSIPQEINFVGKSEDDGATMVFIAEKLQKTILNFFLDSLIVTE